MTKDYIISSVLTLILFAIIFGIIFIVITINEHNTWNNGYHSCGGKWVYAQPVGHAYSTYFLYECDKCGEMHEFDKKK